MFRYIWITFHKPFALFFLSECTTAIHLTSCVLKCARNICFLSFFLHKKIDRSIRDVVVRNENDEVRNVAQRVRIIIGWKNSAHSERIYLSCLTPWKIISFPHCSGDFILLLYSGETFYFLLVFSYYYGTLKV